MSVSVRARLMSQANTVDLVSSPESSAGSANHRRAVRRARSDGSSLGAGASSVVGIVESRFCQTELNATGRAISGDLRATATTGPRGCRSAVIASRTWCPLHLTSVVIMDREVNYGD